MIKTLNNEEVATHSVLQVHDLVPPWNALNFRAVATKFEVVR